MRNKPSWRTSTLFFLLTLPFFGGSVACRATDARFDGAPTIRATDVKSSNAADYARRKAAESARNKLVEEKSTQPIPLNSARRGAPLNGNEQIPSDHPPIDPQNNQGIPSQEPSVAAQNLVQPDSDSIRFDSVASYGSTGPLRWVTPKSWKGVKPGNSFRIAEYLIPGTEGAEAATMSVFHFPGGGGGIQANISRWISQFTPTAGETSSTKTIEVGPLKVWRIRAAGLFNPGMAGGPGAIREDFGLNGAIVETDEGPFFFKLVGPKPTIEASEKDFETFVQSFALAPQ